MWLRKRETKFLLIAAQNYAIKTNHIKVKIDKTQQNSKRRLCGERDETNQPHNKRMQQIRTKRI